MTSLLIFAFGIPGMIVAGLQTLGASPERRKMAAGVKELQGVI